MKNIMLLGSTGSIGTQTLEVVRAQKDIEVTALAAGSNITRLEEQIREFHPEIVCVWEEEKAKELALTVSDLPVKVVCGMDDILNAPVDGSGCNEKYGLLGSNKSTEDTIKLFPRDCMDLVNDIQKKVLDRTGKHVEVMVYGDGAFKDPVGKIWELADPVVSVANTEGLEGTPNEVKLKYLADNDFKDLSGEALKNAVSQRIKEKKSDLVGDMASQGTTPRRLTDLIGSLCDLTSGSGDKGTPVILVQGYFDNYTN